MNFLNKKGKDGRKMSRLTSASKRSKNKGEEESIDAGTAAKKNRDHMTARLDKLEKYM